jgi:hypothetical protein
MAQGFQFKSFMRTLAPGKPYQDASAVLNTLGAAGWELVSVIVVPATLQKQWAEVFYLQLRTNVVVADLNSPPGANSPP